jgi:hypothetical protein
VGVGVTGEACRQAAKSSKRVIMVREIRVSMPSDRSNQR